MQRCTVAWWRDCILNEIREVWDNCLVELVVVHLLFVI